MFHVPKLQRIIEATQPWTITLLLSSLFLTALFPIDKVFINSLSFSLGAYSDFTTFKANLFDILLISATLYIGITNTLCPPRGDEKVTIPRGGIVSPRAQLLLYLIFFYHVVGSNFTTWWGLYQFGTSIRLIILTYVSCYYFSVSHGTLKTNFLKWFALVLVLIESLITTTQFFLQRSIGLKTIGESVLNGSMFDVAKVVSHETLWLRSYGTFPHPNILAGATAIAIISLVFKMLKSKTFTTWWVLALFSSSLVLATTASRGGLIAMLVGIGVLLCFMFHMEHERLLLSKTKLVAIVVTIIIPFLLLHEVWYTQNGNRNSAVTERYNLQQAGIKIIKEHTIFGVGNGNIMFHMKHALPSNTPTWEVQPIHNYWLLVWAEKGLLGLMILLCMLYYLLRKSLEKVENSSIVLWWAIGAILFTVSLFDHYLYTLLQGQIILWVWVGWGIAICDKPNPAKL